MAYFSQNQVPALSRYLTYLRFNPVVKQLGKPKSILIMEIIHYAA